MSPITTQVIDTSEGKPGSGIRVILERKTHSAGWLQIADGMTNADGRLNDLLPADEVFLPGHYKLVFETAPYFLLQERDGFFPQITITFVVKDPMQHYHLPLLINSFGYTIYRGS